jgi:hypothetical protein
MNPDIINITNIILSIFLTAAIVFISYRQYIITKHNFRFGLYKDRYRIFEVTNRFLFQVTSDVNRVNFSEFHSVITESYFIFGDEIRDYLETLLTKSLKYRSVSGDYDSIIKRKQFQPIDDKSAKKTQSDISELSEWFNSELSNIKTKFMPYLNFKDIK